MKIQALLIAESSNAVLITFLIYIIGVFLIAGLSNRLLKNRNFLSEYFLGSRGLGVWAFALTLAATSSSGGSFMGFPSKIYTHGWSLGLWIGSYMVVPICVMGLLGKRINQVARISGAITIPDVLRDRFRSAPFGLIAVALIVFFMTFNLVAQFKAGSEILRTLLGPIDLFGQAASALPEGLTALSPLGSEYVLCLLVFGISVILYTTYGGFHAVVWTDVMQGIVMVVGVIIMLPLAINQAGIAAASRAEVEEGAESSGGNLELVTRSLARMVPPRKGTATLESVTPASDVEIPSGAWVFMDSENGSTRLFKIVKRHVLTEQTPTVEKADVWEIVSAGDVQRVRDRIAGNQEGDRDRTGVVALSAVDVVDYVYGASEDQQGAYVTGPGPHRESANGFLPLSLAISFFFMWAISGTGQPSNMVRLMAFKDTPTLRRSIFTVALYYSAIYFPLVVIFCCARVLIPGMESEPDRIMPQMAVELTSNIGMGWLAGLLIAAPFAAVMSTVDSFLLMISSALVRDIYQRNIDRDATEQAIKKLSYAFTMIIGLGALLGALHPPEFLQDIIVYTGSGLASCFLGAVVYSLYWPRANHQGCIAAMLSGFLAHLSLYCVGFLQGKGFSAFKPWDMDPVVVGLLASFVIGYVVTLMTPPPADDLVKKYFYRQRPMTGV
ncbi:MAG TPA: hypothetical protein DCE55_04420 [Planctomycetaceae bacterium]|nr:hypothetical protein [Planctomycetaceae bacterium]|tara:strand:+ start:5297 stop:7300 length:2004 start_codon:yes stop_codon:yes gene_type:complete